MGRLVNCRSKLEYKWIKQLPWYAGNTFTNRAWQKTLALVASYDAEWLLPRRATFEVNSSRVCSALEEVESACVCPIMLCCDYTPLHMCIVYLFATAPSHAAPVSLS